MSSRSKDEWLKGSYEPTSAKSKPTKPAFRTSSGTELDPLYCPEDFEGDSELGYPGEFPFTRGVYPTMYRGRMWTMRQYSGFGTARETNERFRYLLGQGQTGLSVAFDLPTQLGLDSDHPMSEGEVGKVGVAIDSMDDMRVLFDGIRLDQVSTSMTINSTAAILLAMYVALAREQGADISQLAGTVQNDILKEYVARGTYIYPPEPSMRLIVDIFRWCAREIPRWNAISISGYHIREAGSTAAQELGFTFANGIAYVQAALEAGLDVDDFGPRLSFFFGCHSNFVEEVAKFRAGRRLWAEITRDRFGARDPRSQMMRFHTQTCGCTLTAQQPLNNVVRVAYQALAAVFGGTQSLHTNSYDEAHALPSEESVRIALRTQQIVAHETGITDSIDPLGGSYMLEALTDDVEAKASDYIEKIDAMGGAVRAVETGYMQREIQESAYSEQQRIDAEEQIVVGVNRFEIEEKAPEKILRIDPSVRDQQVERLAKLRKSRDSSDVTDSLKRLEDAAATDTELMPPILECVEAQATVGEISDALRNVFGVQKPITIF
jgi:methylmalonyl-CoA mutase N-terminal domain/subunit